MGMNYYFTCIAYAKKRYIIDKPTSISSSTNHERRHACPYHNQRRLRRGWCNLPILPLSTRYICAKSNHSLCQWRSNRESSFDCSSNEDKGYHHRRRHPILMLRMEVMHQLKSYTTSLSPIVRSSWNVYWIRSVILIYVTAFPVN